MQGINGRPDCICIGIAACRFKNRASVTGRNRLSNFGKFICDTENYVLFRSQSARRPIFQDPDNSRSHSMPDSQKAPSGIQDAVNARRRGRPPRADGRNGGAQVQSLSRALGLLESISRAENGISLSDLAQQVKLAPSTAHRLLNTLEQHRFANLDPQQGLWFVGVGAFTVGNAYLANRDHVAVARPFMQQLMEESGESINLANYHAGQVVFLSQVQCREMMRMLVRLGSRAPMHASGAGKALLAAMTEQGVKKLIQAQGLPHITDNTLDRETRLHKDLENTRKQGFAFDNEEHAVGLRCVASTVHDEHGEAIAAVSISGPRARITDERIQPLGNMVMATANRITAAIGGRLPAWRRRATNRMNG